VSKEDLETEEAKQIMKELTADVNDNKGIRMALVDVLFNKVTFHAILLYI